MLPTYRADPDPLRSFQQMIGDRHETQSSKDIVDFGVWDRAHNIHGLSSLSFPQLT